jgi:hypothetical protein
MNIYMEFVRGMNVGIEFPGDGYHCVIHLLILRIMFVSDEIMEEVKDD